jgi:hypothetical protein
MPGDPQVTIDGWTLSRLSMHFRPYFSVHIQATRTIGSAVLTYDIRGTLRDFRSNGSLHVSHQQLNQSQMTASGLRGGLTAQWSLSAPLSNPIAGLLALNFVLPLFRMPLLVDGFPIFLSVEAKLRLAPQFGPSTQVLHGQAEIGFLGGQGFTFAEHVGGPTPTASVTGNGGLHHWNVGPPNPSGQQFALPGSLDLAATFPYLEISDDFNNPVTGALVWTGFTLDTLTGPGTDPGPCLRVSARVHADVGVTAWLFGLHADVSRPLFADNIGWGSLPSSPACV